VQLGADPESEHAPPRVTMTPAVIEGGGTAVIRVDAPGADSIALESVNGLDRYGTRGSKLSVKLNNRFGQAREPAHYAVHERGHLFDVVKQPIKITTCWERRCQEHYEAVTIHLPERNRRSVAVTGGAATVFTRRAITGVDKSVLFREALSNSLWSLQAEVALRRFNARLQGYYNTGAQGGALDLSQTFNAAEGDGLKYGVAMHLAGRRVDWLRGADASAASVAGTGLGLGSPTAYQASIGPSLMLKGLTASSQLGLYTDGHETLQVMSTFVSLNGNLTDVRSPITMTLEKTFAFGGGPFVPRRRDGTDRMMVGVQIAPNLALRLGMHSYRSAWPVEGSATDNIQASETYYSVGAQYTLSW
jgi:hypothetical protein